MNKQQIQDFFEKYCNNMKEKQALSDALLNTKDKSEWMKALLKRATRQGQLYKENNQIIREILLFLDLQPERLYDEIADAFYDGIMKMCSEGLHDVTVITHVIEPLITYYVQKDDINRLVTLYYVKFYEMEEMISRGVNFENPNELWSNLEAILQFKDLYTTRFNPNTRGNFFAVYFNLAVVGLDSGYVSVEDSYRYIEEMLSFWNTKEVQALDGNNLDIIEIVERAQIEWMATLEDQDEIPAQITDTIMKISDLFYQKELAKNLPLELMQYEVIATHLHMEVLKNHITWDQAFCEYLSYFKKHCAYYESSDWYQKKSELSEASNEFFDYLFFFVNVPSILLCWVDKYQISESVYKNELIIFMHKLDQMWNELYCYLPAPYLDEKIFKWSFVMISHMGDTKKQENWITKVIMKRHVTTYIHSVMVEKLAIAIASHILSHQPEIFASINDHLQLQGNNEKEHILSFVGKAALFHDIGKTRIAHAVDLQTRYLTESELKMIRLHPNYGYQLIDRLTVLKPYGDVILGHHKYYNGKNGYPVEFDNLHSPVKIIIDLITICDSLDAMTDPIGRNYVSSKSFDTFLAELSSEKGSRYNPEIADHIIQHPDLCQKLSYLTTTGRNETCYEIYDEFCLSE